MRWFWMVYAVVLIIGLVAWWRAPARPGDEPCAFPAVVVPTKGKAVLYETWDQVPYEWGEGDAVILDWQDGLFTVNGHVHRPHAPEPPMKVEVLRRLYGRVPFILNYVAHAEGDSVTRWNDASEAWEQLHRRIYGYCYDAYDSLLAANGDPRAAADGVVSLLSESVHVDSAVVKFYGREPDTLRAEASIGMIGIRWKGMRWFDHIEMPSRYRDFDPSRYKDQGPTWDEACRLVRMVRQAFRREGTYRVEFVRGQLNMFGTAGVQYSTGGRRSTDPRFRESSYVEVK